VCVLCVQRSTQTLRLMEGVNPLLQDFHGGLRCLTSSQTQTPKTISLLRDLSCVDVELFHVFLHISRGFCKINTLVLPVIIQLVFCFACCEMRLLVRVVNERHSVCTSKYGQSTAEGININIYVLSHKSADLCFPLHTVSSSPQNAHE